MPYLHKPKTSTKPRAKKDRKSVAPEQVRNAGAHDRPIPYRLADTSIGGLLRETLGRLVHDEVELVAKEFAASDELAHALHRPVAWEDRPEPLRELDRRIGERLWRLGYSAGGAR